MGVNPDDTSVATNQRDTRAHLWDKPRMTRATDLWGRTPDDTSVGGTTVVWTD